MNSFKIHFQTDYEGASLHGFSYNNEEKKWVLESNIDSNEILDHWNNIIDQLVPIKDKLTNRSKLNIIIYEKERIPSIIISPCMSKFCGDIKTNISIIQT